MKILDIKTQEVLIGISYVNTDEYYAISDSYRAVLKNRRFPKQANLFKKWGYTELRQNGITIIKSYCILREMGEELFYNLYRELIQPVTIDIGKDKELFYVQFLIDSSDDALFSYWFNDKNRIEAESIKDKIVEWIDLHPIIIKEDIIKFLEELGGIDESW